MDRIHRFDGIHNFRDFGAYAAGDRRIKAGRLFRSGAHGRASDADLERLANFGFSAIVDMRLGIERRSDPSRRWDGFSVPVIDNDIEDRLEHDGDPYIEWLRASTLEIREIHDWNRDYYRTAPFLPRHVDLLTRYFRALAQADGPILVHCAAGKDRTGIAVALTHNLLGVHRDDIIADYLLTNDPHRFATYGPEFAKRMGESTGRAFSDAAVYALLEARPDMIETGLSSITSEHGSFDGYFDNALSIDAATRDQIRARLLE